jgi:glycolate oxidase FAD binding subunit
MSPPSTTSALDHFVAEVGANDPVTVVGGRTQWSIGGDVDPAAREVRAPSGVMTFDPAEMTVRVGAGTSLGVLDDALAEHGQFVAFPENRGATVGGVISVGRGDVRQLGRGPVRNAVLEIRYVSAEGHVVKAGGPTVKNVSGFDLCRLLVGSLGTIGLMAEVVLRTRPRPVRRQWWCGATDPFDLYRAIHRPTSILWDGTTTWALLEGGAGEVAANGDRLADRGLRQAETGPDLPTHRWSMDPASLPRLIDTAGPFVAEVGIGIVHRRDPQPAVAVDPAVRVLHERIRDQFDPTHRLNPGRHVMSP